MVATVVDGARGVAAGAFVTIGVEGVAVDDGASTMLATTEDGAASALTDIDADASTASTAGASTETCVGGVGDRCSICATACADGGGGLMASVATCADG